MAFDFRHLVGVGDDAFATSPQFSGTYTDTLAWNDRSGRGYDESGKTSVFRGVISA
jgi:hypothetical protein